MKRFFIFFCILIFSKIIFSQEEGILLEKIPAPPIMVARVKQFGQLIERFNYEKDFYGNKIDSNFSSKISRKEYIKLLFEKNYLNNEENIELIREFIDTVCSEKKTIFLDEHSDNIFVEANSKIEYKGIEKEATLFLIQEREEIGIKWVIKDIKSDFLSLEDQNLTISDNFLSPTSHEINFTSLQKALVKENDMERIIPEGYDYDELSVFLYLVKSGQIKFLHVESKKFHILAINGYYIIVEEFIRNDINSGWLISELGLNEKNVEEYIVNLKE